MEQALRGYYSLTKPGIMGGNALTAAAGFFLASHRFVNPWLLLVMLLGLSLIIASASIWNNYIDRFTDAKMVRTRKRALVTGAISPRQALWFAVATGVSGMLVLSLFTNLLATTAALLGFCVYVLLYSLLKYHTRHATLIGSVAGAMPPVVGYLAVSGRMEAPALILFALIALWQMPHFFAIALYQLDDYTAAAIPLLPIQKGSYATKIQMLLYILAFVLTAPLLTLLGDAGYVYLSVTTLVGLIWLGLCCSGFRCRDEKVWARRMFLFSLVVVTALSISLFVGPR